MKKILSSCNTGNISHKLFTHRILPDCMWLSTTVLTLQWTKPLNVCRWTAEESEIFRNCYHVVVHLESNIPAGWREGKGSKRYPKDIHKYLQGDADNLVHKYRKQPVCSGFLSTTSIEAFRTCWVFQGYMFKLLMQSTTMINNKYQLWLILILVISSYVRCFLGWQ